MEFNFSVNALFREKLSKVKNNLMPENYGGDRRGDGDVVTKVSTVLDKMGIVSAKAQNLPMAITSASKLRNSDHVVYILTDPEGNRGHGTVVGILKVGCKKLFVYNLSGVQWEMEPLCVLDFYVHESKQRNGCGRQLFEYMLKDQQISPNHLALDQPSESFLSFMCKHYGLDSIIPQTNSFVVYESFFDGRADKGRGSTTVDGSQSRKGHRNALQCVRASSHSGDATPSYGRHSAKKAGSTMAEYMQDPSMMQSNGSRQGPPHTNHYNYDVHRDNNSTPTKFGTTKPVEAENGQMRPTSLPEKLNGSSAAAAARDDSAVDEPDVADDNSEHNGSEFATPEEVPGKLDLKFHHTHLW